MSITAAALRELHHLHTLLADLNDRLERGPRTIRAAQAKVAQQRAAVDEAHATVLTNKKKSDQMQLDLKSSEARIEQWNGKLNTAASNKEYQTLQEQIAAAEMANSVQADEILELLERIDEFEAAARQAEERLQAVEDECAATTARIQEAAEGVRADIARYEQRLAEAETGIPGDFRTDYNRVIRQKGADGMAEAEEGVCTGCGQKITLNMQNELLLSKPTFCNSCGRLLYLPE